MVSPGGCLRFGKGYPCNLWPWKPQNSQISMEFEDSEGGIVKFLRKIKVVGGVAGRERESFQGATTARPGSHMLENLTRGASRAPK